MTYFGFLALFLGLPILVLGGQYLRDRRAGLPVLPAWAIALMAVIALVYTTPWDNYLVATRVWWYDPELVTGIVFGWVPIEEYTFFVVQPIFVGLWLSFWMVRVRGAAAPRAGDRSAAAAGDRPGSLKDGHLSGAVRERPSGAAGARPAAVAVIGLVWLTGIAMLVSEDASWTYLGLELVWALPPVALQLGYGADLLLGRWKLVLLGIVLPTLYLSAADSLAIGWGTWTIDPAQSTGLLLGGVLPVEEFIFFLLTNVLLTFGLVLVAAPESRARLMAILARYRGDPAGEPA